jgi:hypothetical protein
VFTTVIELIANTAAIEHTNPRIALLLLFLLRTRHLPFDFATVAFCVDFDRTAATDALVTRSLTCMLSTR